MCGTKKPPLAGGGFSLSGGGGRRGSGGDLRQGDEFGFDQGLDGLEGFKDLVGDRGIDLDDGEGFDGLGAGALAAEGEVGDVDAVLAEDGADLADDAGDVVVAADEQVAFERGFDVDAVEFEQAGLFAVDDGGRGLALALGGVEGDGEDGGGAAAGAFAFSSWMRMPRSWATAAALMRLTFSEP